MQPVVLLLTRLASQLGRGQLAEARERAVRALVVGVGVAILAIVAILLVTAAIVLALAQWIGMIPALLALAAALVILALLLVVFGRHRTFRRSYGLVDPRSGLPGRMTPPVATGVVLAGLAVGLVLGLRGRS
jgi:hypothetical protein